MSLREAGEIVTTAAAVKDVQFSTPISTSTCRKAYKLSSERCISLSGVKVLSILVEVKLTKFHYNLIRSETKNPSPTFSSNTKWC